MYPFVCRGGRVLPTLLALLLAAAACGRPQGHAQHPEAPPAAVDWARVSDRDLNLASVFLVARERGVRAALDSLSALARADSALEPMGHALAHGLGRYAEGRRPGDLSVFAECRPSFHSGCYHGVLEGYLAVHPGTTGLRGICGSPALRGLPPYAFRECAHGLGHGVSGVHGADLEAALGDCGALLTEGIGRRECMDGVFMENVVRAAGTLVVKVGDAAGGHAQHAMPAAARLRADDPYFPCDSASAQAAPSCWAYQPVVWLDRWRPDLQRVLQGCGRAPAQAAPPCYGGVGKQVMGLMPAHPDSVAALCARAGAHRDDCLAGAVAFFVDEAWDPAPAFAFCARLSGDAAAGCVRAVGAAVGWIDPAPAAIVRGCAPAATLRAVCEQAARAEEAERVLAREAR